MAQTQNQSIQQLLAAEKRATEKVNAARVRKAKKLKRAKDEAEEEIERYRKEREQQFQEYLKKYAGSRGKTEKQIEIDTYKRINDINRAATVRKDEVIRGILEIVQNIKPVTHKNYRNVA